MNAQDEPRPPATASTAERVLLAAVIALLLLMNALAVANQLGRALDHDEAEYLHAAWLMDHGKRIYRDFLEDHPPFLFQLLRQMRTESVFDWAVRARLFSAMCGTWAMIAAGLIVWRITRSAPAAVVTLAALLGAHLTWVRGIADIRADAPTLALFVTGFLLLIWDDTPSWSMAWRTGCGISLALAADLWNPKWPLVGLCLGVYFFAQCVRLMRVRAAYLLGAFVPILVTLGLFYAALTRVTTLDDYVFFNFLLKARNMDAFASQAWVVSSFRGLSPFHYAPPRFVGPVAIGLYLLAFLLAARSWRSLLVLVSVIAAALEVRYLYPWPYIWPQFFLLFSFVLAMAYGLLSAAIIRWTHGKLVAFVAMTATAALVIAMVIVHLATEGISASTAIAQCLAIALVAAPIVIAVIRRDQIAATAMGGNAAIAVGLALALPHLSERMDVEIVDRYTASWPAREELLRKLQPGETVWIGASRHPVAAHDASYFTYSFTDLVPTTLALIATQPDVQRYLPPLTADSLPVCQFARRRSGSLRFLEISAYAEFLPGACACAQVALSRPDLVPTEVAGVYEVLRPGVPVARGPAPAWDAFVRERVARCASRE
ncbi:MAG TPA: hypothetical protein VNI54_07770 [Thermoanaerobaculia bacterium]|nr:hypothetical protein [Thermoanaerobaculia bacterium]